MSVDILSLVESFMIMITSCACAYFLVISAFFMMQVAGILILKNKKSEPIEGKEKITFLTSIVLFSSWILLSISVTKGFSSIHFLAALLLTVITVKFIRIVQSMQKRTFRTKQVPHRKQI